MPPLVYQTNAAAAAITKGLGLRWSGIRRPSNVISTKSSWGGFTAQQNINLLGNGRQAVCCIVCPDVWCRVDMTPMTGFIFQCTSLGNQKIQPGDQNRKKLHLRYQGFTSWPPPPPPPPYSVHLNLIVRSQSNVVFSSFWVFDVLLSSEVAVVLILIKTSENE